MMKSTSIVEELCKVMVSQNKNIVISGLGGSGKTTLMNHILTYRLPDQDLFLIQDIGESDLTALDGDHVRRSTIDQSFSELIRSGLHKNPTRIVVSEIRSAEVLELIALDEGTSFITTVRAQDASRIPQRFVNMALSGTDDSIERLIPVVNRALDYGITVVREESHGENGTMICYINEIIAFGENGESIVVARQHLVDGEVILDLTMNEETLTAESL